jgi:hypothetical protein
MFRRRSVVLSLPLLFLLPALSPPLCAQAKHQKSVWNYDGGLQLMTDGSLPSGTCFRLTGRAMAPDFFENLKREDTDSGTLFHRGSEIVTEFPEKLHASFLLYDQACPSQLHNTGTHVYLTRADVSSLRISFFWKRGMAMRPASGVTAGPHEMRRIAPYAAELADQLPEKLEWFFEFDVPSAGVPIADSLVVVIRTTEGYIAARAPLRM